MFVFKGKYYSFNPITASFIFKYSEEEKNLYDGKINFDPKTIAVITRRTNQDYTINSFLSYFDINLRIVNMPLCKSELKNQLECSEKDKDAVKKFVNKLSQNKFLNVMSNFYAKKFDKLV